MKVTGNSLLKRGRCLSVEYVILVYSLTEQAREKTRKQQYHPVLCPLTRETSWRSWCCHENGDTQGWRTGSLPPCWYKSSLGYSCAAGSNIRPHLEDKTAQARKNEERGERLARLTPCFLVTTARAVGAVQWVFIFFIFSCLVSHKRLISQRFSLQGDGEVIDSTGKSSVSLRGADGSGSEGLHRHLCTN